MAKLCYNSQGKNKIRHQLRERRKSFLVQEKNFISFKKHKIEYTNENIHTLLFNLNLESDSDLYYRIAKESITEENLTPFIEKKTILKLLEVKKILMKKHYLIN